MGMDSITRRIGAWLGRGGALPGVTALVVGVILGVGAYQVGTGGQVFNILAPPALLLILANLGSYALKLIRLVLAPFLRTPPRVAAWIADRKPAATTDARQPPPPDPRLLAARLSLILNAMAIGLALGVIAGIYLRGLVVEYRAGWESTLLDSDTAAAAIRLALAPSSALLGLDVPETTAIRALRLVDGTGGGPAATWLHLWSAAVACWIVIPRSLLLLADTFRIQRLRDAARAARAPARPPGAPTPVTLVTYCLPGGESRANALAAPIDAAMEASIQPRQLITATYGAEDDLPEPSADDPVVVVAGIGSTPEAETHGLLLSRLAAQHTVTVLLDPEAWRIRGQLTPERLESRIQAWRSLAPEGTRVIALATKPTETAQVP